MWKKQHLYNQDAAGYDAFIRGFVPAYDTMQQRVVDTLCELSGDDQLSNVIELGVGVGSLGFRLLSGLQISRYYGYEESANLAAVAKSRLSIFRCDVKVLERDFRRDQWPTDVDAVVSTLTFHYLCNVDKQAAFRKAFQSLRPGGLLVVGDRVISQSPTLSKVYHARMTRFWDETTKYWKADKRAAHKTQDDPKEEPWVLEDQMQWLKEIGFAETECIWRDFNYCVFCGIKPDIPFEAIT
jgi:tRNA (cmo5U34)-methyltransferase